MKALVFVTAGLILLNVSVAQSQPAAATTNAATAWAELQQAAVRPKPPAAWDTQSPTPAEDDQYCKQVADAAMAAAKTAKAFYAQFPDSTNVIAARILECRMLERAFHFGGPKPIAAYEVWLNAENALLAAPGLTEDERFDERMHIARGKGADPEIKTWQARNAQYENDLRQLVKDYPNKEKAWTELVIFGAELDDTKAREIANEVVAGPAPDSAKDTARAILRRLDAVGKPLDIQFTAVDGRKVDLSQMKGKVVLVDFWATWCGPCVGEIPHVKEAYEKLHAKGFEVVGISFDGSQKALTDFIRKRGLPWPQYFDNQGGWKNKFGVEYAIDSIPTMWLVDKQGNLRDVNARDGLQARVEKLLAE